MAVIDKLVIDNPHEARGFSGYDENGNAVFNIQGQTYTSYKDEQGRVRLDIPSFDANAVDFGQVKGKGANLGSAAALEETATGKDAPNYSGFDKPASELDEAAYWDTPESQQQTLLAMQRGDAERDRQAAEDDDGFGDILKIGLPIALAAFGVPAGLAGLLGGGTLGAIGAGSLIGLGTSLVTGGNPLKGALLGAAGGFAGSQIFRADAAAGAADFSSDAGAAGAEAAGTVEGASGAIGETVGSGDFVNAGDFAGVSTSPQKMLLADSGGTMTDVGGGMGPIDPGGMRAMVNESGGVDFSGGVPAKDYSIFTGGNPTDAAAPLADRVYVPDTSSSSYSWMPEWMKSGVTWANENPGAARVAGGLVSGGMQLAGGVGAALLNKSALQDKLASDRELLDRKAHLEAQAADKTKKDYFSADLLFSPRSGQGLRRPDGTLVFAPGLVSSRIN